MHVDNWEPETYKWILEECDVPYVPKEWDKLLAKYALEGKGTSPTTILGRYLAKMKLKQYKDYRWKDTEFLQKLEDKRIREGMESQGFSAAEIAQAIEDNHKPAKEVAELKALKELSDPETSLTGLVGTESSGTNDYFAQISPVKAEDVDIAAGLTEEDKQMLYLKWGKTYTPEEWVKLEQLYNEMMQSYDIQTAGHIDSLKLLCKTSLKANQLLDLGDVDGAQKMLRMYDSLMKSGKFTAAQNKAEETDYINSISELVAICEKEGFIPRYYIDKPGDRVDETIADLKGYTRSLVLDEMNLGNLIESAVKTMAQEEAKEEDEDIEEEVMSLEEVDHLKDEDFEAFDEFQEENEKIQEEALKEFL